MPKAADILTQFNAGEFSPLLEGRVDFAKYHNGLRTCENFIPTVQGPAKRRIGSRYVATTKAESHRIWLRPFVASLTEQYVLEFGNHYIRFYINHGQLEISPGLAYEVSTPYAIGDLTTADGVCALQFAQSNDVLYITHPLYAPATLSRTGVGTFAFATAAVGIGADGPFADLNSDKTIVISAAADTGVTTLTASTGIFLDGHVGKYFYLEEGTDVLVHQWETNKAVGAGDRRRSDSKNYIASTAGTTGNLKPVHLEGNRWDGDTGVQWEFTDDGSGVVRIDSLVGAQPTNVVNVTVIKRLPFSITSGPGGVTYRWASSAWTDNLGYPSSVCFFRERLCFAREQSVWMSVAADFYNFATKIGGQVTADSAIVLKLATDQKDAILWLKPDRELIVGTASGEHAIAEYTNGQPLGPANVRADRQSAYGSRQITPLTIGAAQLFVQRGGRVVNEMSYDIRQSQYLSVDITATSEHITHRAGIAPDTQINTLEGILDWTFALRKDRVVWAVRADGVLLGLTYNREQDVVAWHRHKIGYQLDNGVGWGQVESVCAIASPDGTVDDLWLCVKRGVKRHIEYVGQLQQTNLYNTQWGINPELALTPAERLATTPWEVDSFYVDGGLSRRPSIVYAPLVRRQVFLTAGSLWARPADWNASNNTIECVGAGGAGENVINGHGGSGGAYAKVSNVSLSQVVTYGLSGGSTWFNGASHVDATVVAADGGTGPFSPGAQAANCRGDLIYEGGSSGTGYASFAASGGGGAGGPSGKGGNGGSGVGGNFNGCGGGASNGGTAGATNVAGSAGGAPNGGAGGISVAGHPGTSDFCFDGAHGTGGGGGGAWNNNVGDPSLGGAGGTYGGGGGAGFGGNAAGGHGLIVITWYALNPDVVSSVSGLDHLEGLTVQVLADGSPHPDRVVTSGAITLERPAYVVHVGLKAPAILETMQLNSGAADGTAQGKTKRISRLTMRFDFSMGGWVGPNASKLEQLRFRTANDRMDTYLRFFTGDKLVEYPGDYEEAARVYVLQDQPLPMTVCGIYPLLITQDNR